jgi:threonine dehydrogenase-like Zn-dependent dehydrogenase
VQVLRALAPSCKISALARYPHQKEAAKRLGADEIIGSENIYEETARITGGKLYKGPFNNRMLLGGYDVIYDCVGSSQTIHDGVRCVRAGGTVVLVGAKMKKTKADLSPLWYQEVRLVGMLGHGMEMLNGKPVSTYDLTCDLLSKGKLSAKGLITHQFNLQNWKKAVKTSENKSTGAIKVVFNFTG